MTNLYCQPDWISNSLGDTPLGVSVKAFHEKFKTKQGRPILSVGDSRLDRLEWVGECEQRTNVDLCLFSGCRHSVANRIMFPPKTVSQN